MIKLPLKIGSLILTGKFKNRKETVKKIGRDLNGQPTINGKKMLTFRIAKMMKKKEEVNNINLEQIVEDIFGE